MLRGEKATEKADVFSFGVILWELGTKRFFFFFFFFLSFGFFSFCNNKVSLFSQPYPNMKAKEIMASARSGLVLLEIPKVFLLHFFHLFWKTSNEFGKKKIGFARSFPKPSFLMFGPFSWKATFHWWSSWKTPVSPYPATCCFISFWTLW